jgi:hypothetical protein
VYRKSWTGVGFRRSPTPTIRSPGITPEAAAGAGWPFNVVRTWLTTGVGVRGSPKNASHDANRIAATTKCMPGPEKITSARCQIGFEP